MQEHDASRALVLLGGALSHFTLRKTDWDMIIAADSGATHALDQGVLPDRVVGDFDSLPAHYLMELEAHKVEMKRLQVDKDLTDGEAAVEWAIRLGAKTVVLAGGLGGRFDHTMGNVLLLHRLAKAQVFGYVTDGRQRVYLVDGPMQLYGTPGDQLSIVPLTPTLEGVHMNGVRWPLVDATLSLGSTRSLSNELIEPRVNIALSSGLALLITVPRSML